MLGFNCIINAYIYFFLSFKKTCYLFSFCILLVVVSIFLLHMVFVSQDPKDL